MLSKTDFILGYNLWKSVDDLMVLVKELDYLNLKALVRDYYFRVYAVYDYHSLLRNNLIKTNKDIPKKIKQAFNNETYLLKRYAGVVNEKNPEVYIKLFDCEPYEELNYFGRTFTKFFTPPKNSVVDVPIAGTPFKAHFFNNFVYYIFCKTPDTQKKLLFYKDLLEDFITIKLLDLENDIVKADYGIR